MTIFPNSGKIMIDYVAMFLGKDMQSTARWIESPAGVCEAMGSNSVGDSEFFL